MEERPGKRSEALKITDTTLVSVCTAALSWNRPDGGLVVRDRLAWRKPARCDSNTCVEVALDGDEVLIRNSTVPDVYLVFPRGEWRAFVRGLRERSPAIGDDRLAA
jgi:hypothetical protein